jgi:hypothetical protein
MLVHSFAHPATTSLPFYPYHANSPPATETWQRHVAPLPSQKGCGPVLTKSVSTKGIGGEGKQGGPRSGRPAQCVTKPRYDESLTSVFAYSYLPDPPLTTPCPSADVANHARSEQPTTARRHKAQLPIANNDDLNTQPRRMDRAQHAPLCWIATGSPTTMTRAQSRGRNRPKTNPTTAGYGG